MRMLNWFCAVALAGVMFAQAPTISLKDALDRARQYGGQIQSANLAVLQAREDRVQAHAATLPSVNAFNQFIYTEGNGTPSGVFVANDGVHVYNEQAVVHQELLSLVRHGEIRRAMAAEAIARAKVEVAARGLTGFRMVDCMFGALAMMLPGKVPAAGDGGNTGISIGGYDERRKPFVYVDFTCGAWGGSPWADGLDGNSHMMANMASQSIEVTEAEMPLAVTAYEFMPDKAGAGKFRGGVPFRRDYRFLEHEGMLQVRSDRRDHRPFGLYGGGPGQPSENYLNPDTDDRLIPSKLTMTIRKGDVFRHVLAGGGGWGDPLERDSAAVLRDVRNEFLSAERARADYGVIVDTKAWRVDIPATEKLRADIKAARGWREAPKVQWHDPATLHRAAG